MLLGKKLQAFYLKSMLRIFLPFENKIKKSDYRMNRLYVNKTCMSTHCVLLLLTGSTVQAVCPSRTWWVLEVMAGLKGDWNSHPHTISSVWPSGGAVRGKNCVNKAECTVPTWNEMFLHKKKLASQLTEQTSPQWFLVDRTHSSNDCDTHSPRSTLRSTSHSPWT